MVRDEAVPMVGESTMRNGRGGCQETCLAGRQKVISGALGWLPAEFSEGNWQ
jgi:hypothetical protein